jgi:ribonuclease HI
MKAAVKTASAVEPKVMKPIDIYCDGSGAGPDGRSGFAWYRPDTDEGYAETTHGATNNQSEYQAILSAINAVPDGSSVRIFTDSELVCNQLTGRFAVHNPDLARLRTEILRSKTRKKLKVRILWIPREKNLADALLRSRK